MYDHICVYMGTSSFEYRDLWSPEEGFGVPGCLSEEIELRFFAKQIFTLTHIVISPTPKISIFIYCMYIICFGVSIFHILTYLYN